MDRGTVARIEDWEQRQFAGGHAGLTTLADQEFSGAVTTDDVWLFMLNGRVIGVFGGEMDDLENARGTVYKAPHPSLPLLFAMQEQGGETQARYFTDDTPLREVNDTLSSGNFTGYVELSENIVSGDYYLVYYGGRSLSVAFVGSSERLLTGEEAFQQATEEVGIYEVRDVNLEVQDVPEPAPGDDGEGEATAGAVGVADAETTGEPDTAERSDEMSETSDTDDEEDVDSASHTGGSGVDTSRPEGGQEDEGDISADVATEESTGAPSPTDDGAKDGASSEPVGASSGEPVDVDGSDESEAADAEPTTTPVDDEPDAAPKGQADSTADSEIDDETRADASEAGGQRRKDRGSPTADRENGPSGDAEERFPEEQEWREARTVPALDPEESETPESPDTDAGQGHRQDATDDPSADSAVPEGGSESPGDDREHGGDRVAELEERIDELTDRLEQLESERADLREERDELAAQRDRLEDRVEELESETAEAESADGPSAVSEGAAASDSPAESPSPPSERTDQSGDATEGGGTAEPARREQSAATQARSMSAGEALSGTDLLIRYDSQSDPTLASATEGGVTPEEVASNLQLQTHTRFDAEHITVDGTPYESFVKDTMEYRFVAWLVGELLFEIRDTNNESGLRDLYEALPNASRAEFHGSITMRDNEGEEHRESFDVILRDKKGQPLVVADMNDSRDPATGEKVADLVTGASNVIEGHDMLAAALFVTASFFEPAAHDVVDEATGTGFLDRDSRMSFVKSSRKRGYHLCLVEAHDETFRLSVPDL